MTSQPDPEPILLSPPERSELDREALLAAFDSGWIAPAGPEIAAFEQEIAERAGTAHAAAVASGTAALHLAIRLLGVKADDFVIIPTTTFIASANAALYERARPLFVDVDPTTLCLDPVRLGEALDWVAAHGGRVGAVLAVDLYGQCANYDEIIPLCERAEVPVIEDAAEALGSTWQGAPAGSFGRCAAFSFNGNKIITTSGGGMLVSHDSELVAHAAKLSQQAREPVPHYEHTEIGFNYRLSNLLAALGRSQLRSLDSRIAQRAWVNGAYSEALGPLGISILDADPRGTSNNWLPVVFFDSKQHGDDASERVRQALAVENIEARATWKPMHLQPVFAQETIIGGGAAEDAYQRGLCLPTGQRVTEPVIERIAAIITKTLKRPRRMGRPAREDDSTGTPRG